MKKLFFLMLIIFSSYSQIITATQSLEQIYKQHTSTLNINSLTYCSAESGLWYEKSGADIVTIPTLSLNSTKIMADNLQNQSHGISIIDGNVVAYRDDKTLKSDWMIYNQKSTETQGGDHIVLTRQYDVIQAKWIDYYMDLDHGTIKDAKIYHQATGMHTTSDQVEIKNKAQYSAQNATLSTCDPNDPSWMFSSKRVDLDYNDAQGKAEDVVFYVESTPILYFPYFQFPLGKRRSGFLMPQLSYGSNAGTITAVPYYWNMAPNYDTTITPKLFSHKGLMLADQLRYLTESDIGSIYTEQMFRGWNWYNNKYRYNWSMQDLHTFNSDLSMGYNYNRVSDDNYFVDFGNFQSFINNINLDQSVYLNYRPIWGTAELKLQQYQTLFPTTAVNGVVAPIPPSPIYAVEPQATFNAFPQELIGGVKGSLFTQYTNFTSNKNQLLPAQRSIIYPNLTLPLNNQWGFIKAKFGYSFSNYEIGSYKFPYNAWVNNPAVPYSVNLGVPISSLDSGLSLERPINLFNHSYVQSLEPRIYYLYIPATNQAQIPVFDTAPSTYNIAQLFNENHFVGYDRINMANDITTGLSTRLINDNDGAEYAKWSLAYRYYLSPENNLIYGSYNQYPQLFNPPPPDLIAELNNNWNNSLSSNIDLQYNSTYQVIGNYALNLKYQPDEYKVLNLRYSYQYKLPLFYYNWSPGQTYNPVEYENQRLIDSSTQWPIYANSLFLDGRLSYDLTRGQMQNLLTGLEYNDGCWALRLGGGKYLTYVNQYSDMYYIQLQLKGLSNSGFGSPSHTLQNSIPGYMDTPGFAPITNIH